MAIMQFRRLGELSTHHLTVFVILTLAATCRFKRLFKTYAYCTCFIVQPPEASMQRTKGSTTCCAI